MLLLPQVMGGYCKKTWDSQEVQGTFKSSRRAIPNSPISWHGICSWSWRELNSGSSLPHMMEQPQGCLLSSYLWSSSHCFWQEHPPSA